MSINGSFPEEGSAVEIEEIPIWKDSVPRSNFWGEEGMNYLLTLTKEDISYMLRRIPRARRDYLKAVNPARTDYTQLLNIPGVEHYNGDKMAAGLRRTPETIEYLWGICKGVCPFPW